MQTNYQGRRSWSPVAEKSTSCHPEWLNVWLISTHLKKKRTPGYYCMQLMPRDQSHGCGNNRIRRYRVLSKVKPRSCRDKTQMFRCHEVCIAFFPTWSLTELPTQFLEFYWFRMLSWIGNFLATNGKGYDNSRLSDDIHCGSRQIHDKWLRFTCSSCT